MRISKGNREIGAVRRIFQGELSPLARAVDPNKLSVLILHHRFNVRAFDIFSKSLRFNAGLTVYNITNALYSVIFPFHAPSYITIAFFNSFFLIIIERINGVPRTLLNAHVRISHK